MGLSLWSRKYLNRAQYIVDSFDPKFWQDGEPLTPGKLRTVAAMLEEIAKLLEAKGA